MAVRFIGHLKIDLCSCQRGHRTSTKPQLSGSNKTLVLGFGRSLTTRRIGCLIIGRNVTYTLSYFVAVIS